MIDIHLGDPCQRVYVKSLGIELLTTRLEGFLDEYTQACYGSIGFPDETKSAGGSLAVGKEIIHKKYMVGIGQIFACQSQLITDLLGEGDNLGLDHIGFQDRRALFFQDQKRYAQLTGNEQCRGNTGAFNGHDLGDALIFEVVGDVAAHFLHEHGIYLMVNKRVNFEDCRA